MHRAFRALLAGALATSMIGLSATSASADRWWGADRTSDVEHWSLSSEPPPCGTVERDTAPRDASTDIVGLSVRHEGETVEVRVQFRNLTGWGRRWLDFSLLTDRRAYAIHLVRDPAEYTGAPVLWAAHPPSDLDGCGYSILLTGVSCPELSMSRSSRRDFVSVVVPRQCLRTPRWVRAGVRNQRSAHGQLHNDAWRTDVTDEPPTTPVLDTLGRRVRHSR